MSGGCWSRAVETAMPNTGDPNSNAWIAGVAVEVDEAEPGGDQEK